MPFPSALLAVELSFLSPDRGSQEVLVPVRANDGGGALCPVDGGGNAVVEELVPGDGEGDVGSLVDGGGEGEAGNLVLCGGEGEGWDLVLVRVEVVVLSFLVRWVVPTDVTCARVEATTPCFPTAS